MEWQFFRIQGSSNEITLELQNSLPKLANQDEQHEVGHYLLGNSARMAHETINDDLFGALTWDSEKHEWHGRAVTARGLAFDLRIDTGVWDMVHPIDDTKVVRPISSASRQAFLRVRDSEQRAREGLVGEFVPLHADWHGEQISPADFQARLRLDSAQILSDGAVQIFYGDDGMFGGHSLIAHLDSSGDFEHGEMFG